MNKKVVVLGGGTGLSTLLRGLKQFPIDITTIVSVCDDGKSTGRLRKEFGGPAVGDIRKVLVALSETEPLVEKLLHYRFETTSDLNGHPVGNLLLTALSNITGNMSDAIESLGKILNLKGKIIPLSEEDVTLLAKMTDGSIVKGEHCITDSHKVIEEVYYQKPPVVTSSAITAIKEADLVILGMGSLFTSIIPNLICKEIKDALDESNAEIMYTCNMMTQPGETDKFSASTHIKLLNKYLGNKKVSVIVVNKQPISKKVKEKYETLEQKDPVLYDKKELEKLNIKIISENFVYIEDNIIRHDSLKLGLSIFSYLLQ